MQNDTIDFNQLISKSLYDLTINPKQYTLLNAPIKLDEPFKFVAEFCDKDYSQIQIVITSNNSIIYTRYYDGKTKKFSTWKSPSGGESGGIKNIKSDTLDITGDEANKIIELHIATAEKLGGIKPDGKTITVDPKTGIATAKSSEPVEQKQADWKQSDEKAADYIKNKPDLTQFASKSSLAKVGTETLVSLIQGAGLEFKTDGKGNVTINVSQSPKISNSYSYDAVGIRGTNTASSSISYVDSDGNAFGLNGSYIYSACVFDSAISINNPATEAKEITFKLAADLINVSGDKVSLSNISHNIFALSADGKSKKLVDVKTADFILDSKAFITKELINTKITIPSGNTTLIITTTGFDGAGTGNDKKIALINKVVSEWS